MATGSIKQVMATVSETATAASGITLSQFTLRKSGKIVIIHGIATISGSLAGNMATVFTLPDGYKPSDEIFFFLSSTYNGKNGINTFSANPYGQFRTRTGNGTFTVEILIDCVYAID